MTTFHVNARDYIFTSQNQTFFFFFLDEYGGEDSELHTKSTQR